MSDTSFSIVEDMFCLSLTQDGKIQTWERVTDTEQPKGKKDVHFTF